VIRPSLSAEHIFAVLNRHAVEFVVIGAFAAIAQGAKLDPTYDIDLTPRRSNENLERLSEVLSELKARIRINDLEEGLVHISGRAIWTDERKGERTGWRPVRQRKRLTSNQMLFS